VLQKKWRTSELSWMVVHVINLEEDKSEINKGKLIRGQQVQM